MEYLDILTSLLVEVENYYVQHMNTPASVQVQQQQNAMLDNIKKWCMNNVELTAALINHTNSNTPSLAPVTSDTMASLAAFHSPVHTEETIDEMNELKTANEDLRHTIAQLRSKNAEVSIHNIHVCIYKYIRFVILL